MLGSYVVALGTLHDLHVVRGRLGLAATAVRHHPGHSSSTWPAACVLEMQHSRTACIRPARAVGAAQQRSSAVCVAASTARRQQQKTAGGQKAADTHPAQPPTAASTQSPAAPAAVYAPSDSSNAGAARVPGSSTSHAVQRRQHHPRQPGSKTLAQPPQQKLNLDIQELQDLQNHLEQQEQLVVQQQIEETDDLDGLLQQLQEQQQSQDEAFFELDDSAAAAAAFVPGHAAAAAAEEKAAVETFGLDEQQLQQLQELQQELDIHQQQQQQQQGDDKTEQQQQQQYDNVQLKPSLMKLLQEMHLTHTTAAQHAAGQPTDQHDTPSSSSSQPSPQQQQRQQTPVADLTGVIAGVNHPQQLTELLLAGGGGGLNQVHLTAAAEALARLARQQQMKTDRQFTRGVSETAVKSFGAREKGYMHEGGGCTHVFGSAVCGGWVWGEGGAGREGLLL